ncbi:MAG: peptide deformylase, partial [Acutalibacteraceae bacterium]
LVNPVVTCEEGEQEETEGCLSCPGDYGVTRRPMKVTVKAQDRNGNTFTIDGEGLKARAFCHEIDHLNGILFKDKVIRKD